jgi:hypothetical protein
VTTLDCVLLKESNRALVAGLGPGPHTEEFALAIEDLLPRRRLRKSFVLQIYRWNPTGGGGVWKIINKIKHTKLIFVHKNCHT